MVPRKDLTARAQYSREYFLRTKESRRQQRRDLNRNFARRKRAADPEKAKQIARTARLQRMGLTQEQFNFIINTQHNRCAICQIEFGNKKEIKAYIDHDHSCCPQNESCGKCVRGLLCSNYNLGLGYFRDSIENLLCAISYLTRFK